MHLESALATVVALEEEARDCYLRLHQNTAGDPLLSQLWFELALEEGSHASVLRQLGELVRRLGAVPPLDLEERELEQLRSDLERCRRRTRGPLSAKEALETAVALEGSELDLIYQRLLRHAAKCVPELARGLEGLAESVEEHRARLEAALKERGLLRSSQTAMAPTQPA